MSKVTWLHLSDLHLSPKTEWNAARILEDLRDDLKELRDEGLQPDLLFFTGDAAYGHLGDGDLSIDNQLTKAFILLEDVRSIFSPEIPPDRVFVVPGNHDVNIESVDDATATWLSKLKEKGIEGKERIEKSIRKVDAEWKKIIERLSEYRHALKEEGYNHLLEDPDRLIYTQDVSIGDIDLGIAGFNSAWACRGAGSDAKGNLWLAGRWQLEHLRGKIDDPDVWIALMHHPFNWMIDLEDHPELKSLFRGDFDFFLHGHEHNGWVQEMESHIQIGAEACYDSPHSNEYGYNIVEIDVEEGEGKVYLREYKLKGGGGWVDRSIPNKTENGGVWKLDLAWLKPESGVDSKDDKEGKSEDSTEHLTGPESRGVFGRSSETEQIARQISDNSITLVYGLSGIGKSKLIDEVKRRDDLQNYKYVGPYPQYEDLSLEDLYRQIVQLLGCREENPSPPRRYFDQPRDYGSLTDYSLRDGPLLIHLTQAHNLFAEDYIANEEIGHFLNSIAEHRPETRIVLESKETPPSISAAHQRVSYEPFKVKGIGLDGLRSYLAHRSSETDIEWRLSTEKIQYIYDRLGGADEQEGAHPLAMGMVTDLAIDLSVPPNKVLDRHQSVLIEDLNAALLNDLYENVLSDSERHLLRICSLYRTAIPESHVPELNETVDDEDAFDHLERRCLFTSSSNQEKHFLHSLIRELVRERLEVEGTEFKENHGKIGRCWLDRAKRLRKSNLSGIEAATEAAHHLLKAERFDLLAELQNRYVRRDIIPELDRYSRELHHQGRREENKRVLELIVAIDPENHKAHRFLGEILEQQNGKGDPEALKHYRIAHEKWPANYAYLNNLGGCLRARGESQQFVDLVDNLDSETKANAFNDQVACTYMLALEDVVEDEKAAELREEKIQQGTDTPSFYTVEAKHRLAKDDPEGALEVIQKAVERGIDEDARLVLEKSRALDRLGQTEEASALRKKEIEKGTSNQEIYIEEISFQVQKGSSKYAERIVGKAEECGIEEDKAREFLAQAYEQSGKTEEASAVREELIQRSTDHAWTYTSRAETLQKKEKYQDALQVLKKAEENGVNDDNIYTYRVSVLREMGASNKASKLRRQLIEERIRDRKIYHQEASYQISNGNPQKALDILDLEKKLEISGDDDYYYSIRAKALERMGRGGQASEIRHTLIEEGTENPAIYNDEANYQAERDDPEEAHRLLDLKEERNLDEEDRGEDYAIAVRAKAFEMQGKGEQASELRQKRIDSGSKNVVIYNDEVEYLIEKDRKSEARYILKKAISYEVGNDRTEKLKQQVW